MTEVLFYHLQNAPLDRVLPGLLERSLERGWRCVVQAGSEERLGALDTHLWTYRDESFLPHGTLREGNPKEQPIYLTTGPEAPNEANVRFFVDGAEIGDVASYDRAVVIFDGNDEAALAAARQAWKGLKDNGHEVTYWQQSERGRWERKA